MLPGMGSRAVQGAHGFWTTDLRRLLSRQESEEDGSDVI